MCGLNKVCDQKCHNTLNSWCNIFKIIMIGNCMGGKGETHTVFASRIPYQSTTWQRRYSYHILSIVKWLPLHTPKKEHRILFTCCNLSISFMWISWLLGKALWYTLYAVIESKPSGGSRRGVRGTPYFWTNLRSEVPKKCWVGDWVPLN